MHERIKTTTTLLHDMTAREGSQAKRHERAVGNNKNQEEIPTPTR